MLGYATLDSIIAAEHFAAAGLEGAKTEVTLNGYSGGSEASTWAAALAPKYAPKLDIVAVAAGGNFPDLDYTTQNFDNSIWYGTEIGVLESFSRALPQDFDLTKLLNASGQALAAKDGQDGSGCAGSTLNEPYGNASQYTNFPDSEALADYPPVKRGLEDLSLKNGPLPKAPLFLYNSVRRRPRVHPAGRRVGRQLLPARRDRRLRPRPGWRRSPQRARAVLEGRADLSRERVRRGHAARQLLDLRREAERLRPVRRRYLAV